MDFFENKLITSAKNWFNESLEIKLNKKIYRIHKSCDIKYFCIKNIKDDLKYYYIDRKLESDLEKSNLIYFDELKNHIIINSSIHINDDCAIIQLYTENNKIVVIIFQQIDYDGYERPRTPLTVVKDLGGEMYRNCFDIKFVDIKNETKKEFIEAIHVNDINKIKVLTNNLSFGPFINNVFAICCYNNNLIITKYLAEKYPQIDVKFNNNVILKYSLKNNHIQILNWLTEKYYNDINSYLNEQYPNINFCNGFDALFYFSLNNFETIKWFYDKYHKGITTDGFIMALYKSCGNGNLEIINWLVATIDILNFKNLELDDINHCYLRACKHGHIDIVELLMNESHHAIDYNYNNALQISYTRKHYKLAKYLINKFPDIKCDYFDYFKNLGHIKDFDAIKYIITKLNNYHTEALIIACYFNNNELVDWIISNRKELINYEIIFCSVKKLRNGVEYCIKYIKIDEIIELLSEIFPMIKEELSELLFNKNSIKIDYSSDNDISFDCFL